MYTKILMSLSVAFLATLGLVATFAPGEVLAYAGSAALPVVTLTIQAAGSLYLGFAIMNWMARDILIGGIYSRPVAMGNLLHFFAMASALLKAVLVGQRQPLVIVVAVTYAVFAVWFGLVVFTSPVKSSSAGS